MSGNITQPSEIVQRIVNVEKVPSKVVDDPSPILAGDLNASGKNINNVNSLAVKNIVCGSLVDWVTGFIRDSQEWSKETFSEKKHSHELTDIPNLEGYIDNIVEDAVSTLAKSGHSHKAQDISGMKEIVEFIVSEMGFAKEGHGHDELNKKVDALAKEILKRASIADINLLIQKIADATKVLSNRISEVNDRVSAVDSSVKSIPKPEKAKSKPEEIFVKVISAEKILIGERCNGLIIKEIVGKDMDGESIIVESSKPVGSRVSKDEIITLKCKKSALVRILFND